MTRDQVTGLLALVLGVAMAVMTSQLPPSMMLGDIGPALFPFIASGLLIICGGGLIIKGRNQKTPSVFDRKAVKRLALIFGIVLIYCVAMNYIGFILPTICVLFALSTLFAENTKASIPARAIFAVALTLAIFLLFRNVLNLKLPTNQLF